MRTSTLIVILLATLSCNRASAAELELKPGLWETTMTRTHPVTGQPVTEVTQSCIIENKFNPVQMMKDVEGCETIKNEVSSNTQNFKMICRMHGSQSTITGSLSTDAGGESGQGNMDLSINARGMQINMNMSWRSKRLGDCPE